MGERGEEIQQETIRKKINDVISDIEKQVCHEDAEQDQSTSTEKRSSLCREMSTPSSTKLQYRRNSKFAQISIDDCFESEVKTCSEETAVSEKQAHAVNIPDKVLTPSTEGDLLMPNRRAMFVDSAFFSPAVHPTWEQQVQMAKKISASLSHSSNRMSRGQSMYEKRKRRSENWIHQEKICTGASQIVLKNERTGDGESREEQEDSSQHPKKPLIKLLMRPNGQAYDIRALQDEDRASAANEILSPEIFSGLVKDLSSPDCKGAQIFAKRKKRSEGWIVDDFHREQRRSTSQSVDSSYSPRSNPHEPTPSSSNRSHAFRFPPNLTSSLHSGEPELNENSKYPPRSEKASEMKTIRSRESSSCDMLRLQRKSLRPPPSATDRPSTDPDSALQQAELEFVAAASLLMSRRNSSSQSKNKLSENTCNSGDIKLNSVASGPNRVPSRDKTVSNGVCSNSLETKSTSAEKHDFTSSKVQQRENHHASMFLNGNQQSAPPCTASSAWGKDESSGVYFQCAVTLKQTTAPNFSGQIAGLSDSQSNKIIENSSQPQGNLNSAAVGSISSHQPVFSKARSNHQPPSSLVDVCKQTQDSASFYPEATAHRVSSSRSGFSNYNTAARGWGATSEFYRPVTFCRRS